MPLEEMQPKSTEDYFTVKTAADGYFLSSD